MLNVMTIEGIKARIAFDESIEMFRGEFVGLNGGADFYATSVADLRAEGAKSLCVFFDSCKKRGIPPLDETVTEIFEGRKIDINAEVERILKLFPNAFSSPNKSEHK